MEDWCEYCGKPTKTIWRVWLSANPWYLCDQCKEDNGHNAAFVEKVEAQEGGDTR